MTADTPTLTVAEAATRLGTDPRRLAARLAGAQPRYRGAPDRSARVPDRRRSSLNEAWWIADDGAWTDGTTRIAPAPATAAAWRAAVARQRGTRTRGAA